MLTSMLIEKVDLDALGLAYGDATRIEGEVAPARVTLGGQDYEPVPAEPSFRLDISRTSAGYALRLRFSVGLNGPCFRCLEAATAEVSVDAREIDQPVEPIPIQGASRFDEDEENEDETSAAELTSPYVEEGSLDQKVAGKMPRLLFRLRASAYSRSRVLDDVYEQTGDERDKSGGYLITVLEAV